MKSRMHNWSAFFTVVGWISIVVGFLAAIPTMFLSLAGVLVGMGLLFTSACLDWMDGVLEHLSKINDTQQATLEQVQDLVNLTEAAVAPEEDECSAEEDADMQAANEAAEAARRRRAEKYDMEAAMRAARNLRK